MDNDRLTLGAKPLQSVLLRQQLKSNLGARDDLDQIFPTAAELARRAPLDALPFEIQLIETAPTASPEMSSRLVNHALSRNPRSALARLYNYQQESRSSDLNAVLVAYNHLATIETLEPELLTDSLVGVFRDRRDWAPLLDYLKGKPKTGNRIVRKLLDETVSLVELADVVSAYPDVQPIYLQYLIDRGLISQAYDAWTRYVERDLSQLAGAIYNGSFVADDAPSPFNWNLNSNFAEYMSTDGLYVTHRGNANTPIASQIITGAPGPFILRTTVSGQIPRRGAVLVWRVSCLSDRSVLAELRVVLQKNNERERLEQAGQIPDRDCDFQLLELMGLVSEYPLTSIVKVAAIELVESEH